MRRNEAARPTEKLGRFEANTRSPVLDPGRSARRRREVRQTRIEEPPPGPMRRRSARIAHVNGREGEDIGIAADVLNDKDIGRPTVPPGYPRRNAPVGALFRAPPHNATAFDLAAVVAARSPPR